MNVSCTRSIAAVGICLFALSSSGCKKEENNPLSPASKTSGGLLTIGAAVDAGSMPIGPGGGTFIITKPGTPVDGMRVRVPSSSYQDMRTYQVSYAPVQSHQFGANITLLSPLITIANGGGYADSLMSVKIPVKVPAGRFAMGFFYNDETGELEGLPLQGRDSTSITVGTRQFANSSLSSTPGFSKGLLRSLSGLDAAVRSNVVVASISELELQGNNDTGFRPGVDDWGFANYGSHAAPGGHCAGQSIGALWYYLEKKSKGSPALWRRFDDDGNPPKTPSIWADDVLGYKFCSVLQVDRAGATLGDKIVGWIQDIPLISDVETFDLFAFALLLTHKPQYVVIWDGVTRSASGHAMIIYGQAGKQLFVCDPNYPGDTQRRLVFNTAFFDPYFSGPNAGDLGKPFSHIYYAGIRPIFDWTTIDSRWQEVAGKTIGQGLFPSFTVETRNDKGEFEVLKDGFTKPDGHFDLSVQGDGFTPFFRVVDTTGRILGTNGQAYVGAGIRRIGVAVYDLEKKWVGFTWTQVNSNAAGLILPLNAGNVWKYSYEGFSADGRIIATHFRKDTVIGFKTVGGDEYAELQSGYDADSTATTLLANRSSGLWGVSPPDNPQLVYEYPAKAEDAYLLNNGAAVHVDSVGVQRPVPGGGAFQNCVVYTVHYAGYPHLTVRAFAVDVGEVETREYDQGTNGVMYLSSLTQLTEIHLYTPLLKRHSQESP